MSDSNLDDGRLLVLFETYLLTEKRASKNTFFAYKKDLEQLLDFFKKNKVTIQSCSKNHLKNFLKFLKSQGISFKTLSRKISSLKAFFNYLHERYDYKNKAKDLIFPKIEKTLPVYLSQLEIQKLLEAANKDSSDKSIRNKVMLYLLYASGMRVSELVGLEVDQIQFDTSFISVMGKGSKERLIPVPKNVLELLNFYVMQVRPKLFTKNKKDAILEKEKNYLFFSCYASKIKPISRQSFWMILKNILKSADIIKNVSPHTLRHSLATHLLKSGANIRSLQMLLGHEQLATVQIYTHLEKSHIRAIYDKKHPRA